jgi:transposase
MLLLDPNDSKELAFTLHKAVRLSGLTLGEICERLKDEYDVELTPSGLSHVIHRGTIRFQRALQILAICGVDSVTISTKN